MSIIKPVIPFTEKAVKEFLDNAIKSWRSKYNKHSMKNHRTSEELALQAADYIDAYQSVRVSLFGELLK